MFMTMNVPPILSDTVQTKDVSVPVLREWVHRLVGDREDDVVSV